MWSMRCAVASKVGARERSQHGLHPRSRVHPVFHIAKVKTFKGKSTKLYIRLPLALS